MQNWFEAHPSVVTAMQLLLLLLMIVVTTGIAKSAFSRRQEEREARRRHHAEAALAAYRAACAVLRDIAKTGRVNPLWVYRDSAISRLQDCINALSRIDARRLDHAGQIRHTMIVARSADGFSLLAAEASSARKMSEEELVTAIEALLEGLDEVATLNQDPTGVVQS